MASEFTSSVFKTSGYNVVTGKAFWGDVTFLELSMTAPNPQMYKKLSPRQEPCMFEGFFHIHIVHK